MKFVFVKRSISLNLYKSALNRPQISSKLPPVNTITQSDILYLSKEISNLQKVVLT